MAMNLFFKSGGNGMKAAMRRLIDGDQIGLGSVLVTFRAAPADASTETRE